VRSFTTMCREMSSSFRCRSKTVPTCSARGWCRQGARRQLCSSRMWRWDWSGWGGRESWLARRSGAAGARRGRFQQRSRALPRWHHSLGLGWCIDVSTQEPEACGRKDWEAVCCIWCSNGSSKSAPSGSPTTRAAPVLGRGMGVRGKDGEAGAIARQGQTDL
jgi:hypothetical protein